MPSRDPAQEARHFTEVLGGELVFAIEAFGARVAMVRLGDGPPDLLLADHLEGERPVLVYRVDDIERAAGELTAAGCDPGPRFGIPHGPCCAFHTPGGHHIAIYEPTRPNATEHFGGRRDF
jgi:hypothetical protein